MIEIFKNTPPKSKFKPIEKYQNMIFKKNYSIEILKDFFNQFPEEKRGRKKFKEKEIQNTKLLIYDEIIQKAHKIKASCIGRIKEKTIKNLIQITVSYYKS